MFQDNIDRYWNGNLVRERTVKVMLERIIYRNRNESLVRGK